LDATALQERQAKQEELPSLAEVEQYEEDREEEDEHTKVLTVEALEALFIRSAPPLIGGSVGSLMHALSDRRRTDFATATLPAPTKLTIGLVGYPNVGKSSTINALIGAKKVSVSATPGHTKNFQTIHLSDEIILCDCPGLVFPQFASTKADLVLDGVLPIDQMREWTAPVDLLCHRIPKDVLEAMYGITIPVKKVEEGGSGLVTARGFLSVYASA
jgi:large subunit GTPase 1